MLLQLSLHALRLIRCVFGEMLQSPLSPFWSVPSRVFYSSVRSDRPLGPARELMRCVRENQVLSHTRRHAHDPRIRDLMCVRV